MAGVVAGLLRVAGPAHAEALTVGAAPCQARLDPPTSGASGTLTVTLDGTPVAVSGTVSPAAPTTFTLGSPLRLDDLRGSGVDIELASGSTVRFESGQAVFSGTLTAVTPLRDGSGNRLRLSRSGSFTIGADCLDLDLSGLQVPAASRSLSLAGYHLRLDQLGIRFSGEDFHLDLGNLPIDMGLPGILGKVALPLSVQAEGLSPGEGLRIDRDGLPSFRAFEFAPRGGVGDVTIPPIEIPQVDGLSLLPRMVDLEVVRGRLGEFRFEADLSLPTPVGDPLVLDSLRFDTPGALVTLFPREVEDPAALAVDQAWGDLALQAHRVLVDLSTEASYTVLPQAEQDAVFGPGASDLEPRVRTRVLLPGWVGILFPRLELRMPHLGQGHGAPAFTGAGVLLDRDGLTGSFTLAEGTEFELFGFGALLGGFVRFEGGEVVESRVTGEILLPFFQDAALPFVLRLSATGAVSVELDTDLVIDQPDLGFDLVVRGGTLTVAADGVSAALSLDGAFVFTEAIPALAGTTLDFAGMRFRPDGPPALPRGGLGVRSPPEVDLGFFRLGVQRVELGLDGDAPSLTLTGRIDFGDGLPVERAGFDGLTISRGEDGRPSLTIGGMHLVAGVPGVARFEGALDEITRDEIRGGVHLSLPVLGPEVAGGGMQLVVGNGYWFAAGTLSLPGTGVPLGPTGLQLYAITAGMGENVRLRENWQDKGVTYQDIRREPGGFVFLAGVDIGTPDLYSMWGDLELVVQTRPHVRVNLHGDLCLLEARNGNECTLGRQAITGAAELEYESGTPSFTAKLAADVAFPSRSHDLITGTGDFELKFSPREQYVRVGGPLPHPARCRHLDPLSQPGERGECEAELQRERDRMVNLSILDVFEVRTGIGVGHRVEGKRHEVEVFVGIEKELVLDSDLVRIDAYFGASVQARAVMDDRGIELSEFDGWCRVHGAIDAGIEASITAEIRARYQAHRLKLSGMIEGCAGAGPFSGCLEARVEIQSGRPNGFEVTEADVELW